MGDLVQEAADVVLPLVASGVAGDLAERGGQQLAEAARRVLAKLRRRVRDTASRDEVEQALRAALAAGEVRKADLKLLVQGKNVIAGSVHAKNVFIGSDIHIDRDFNA
jgi:predicted RNA-binding protein